MKEFLLRSPRLGFRAFVPTDLDAFAAMNADPRVMEYFPAPLSRAESQDLMDRVNQRLEDFGFTFWAAELLETEELIGFIGIVRTNFDADFAPCVEIGWRLAYPFWGKGLAREGAEASLRFAFEEANLEEIYSFTPHSNHRSYGLMKRLGMQEKGRFTHPKIAADSPLNPHVLYHLRREDWLSRA